MLITTNTILHNSLAIVCYQSRSRYNKNQTGTTENKNERKILGHKFAITPPSTYGVDSTSWTDNNRLLIRLFITDEYLPYARESRRGRRDKKKKAKNPLLAPTVRDRRKKFLYLGYISRQKKIIVIRETVDERPW